MIKVIKRDGSLVDFDKSKITSAILKAMRYGSGIVKQEIALLITNECDIMFNVKAVENPTVKQIEDYVYHALVEYGQKETAKAYEGYRAVQEFKRNTHPLDDNILGLVNYTNNDVITENSNKQAMLASTQRDLIAGEVSKHLSLTRKVPTHLVQAHNEGIIKMHDMDYFLNPITNCELVNLKDMLENGTVINKKMIRKPKSLRTASTVATQISAQVSSFTYGGQTMSLSHLAPYVRISKVKYLKELTEQNETLKLNMSDEQIETIAMSRLRDEIKDSVQTFNYQISTISGTNGQSPFISLCMYISEDKEYEEETAMLIEEFLKQRIEGMENEYGVKATQTFPKLLYFLDENNVHKDSKYYYLTQLAIKSTAKRMNPDYISVKKMKEVIGHVFPCMGCRSFLSPWTNENGEVQFYGRGNLGVTTLNLVDIALTSHGDINEFWTIFNNRLELVKESLLLRYEKLKGVKASVAPIMWCHGVISRLQPDDEILPVVSNGRFSLSLGYAGLYETVKCMTGESHTSEKGSVLAEQIMKHMKDTCDTWKKETGLGFGVYGTPQESTSGWFSNKLKSKFGEIKDVTDKGWITNSYHVDIREEIDAFSKLKLESKLQNYSTGGNISYVETYNMEKNLEALEQVVSFIYDNNIYAEINTESDVCGVCKYNGVMDNDPETLDWVCPNCGNRDQNKLSVVRRTCGYLGETTWCTSRKLDILNRVKHL